VDENHAAFGVEPVLRELAIAPSTFGDWRRRATAPCARQLRDAELLARIRAIHAESDGVYGSPRVHAVLRREGEAVSRKRVERLMRENDIVGVSPARKVRTTISNPDDPRPGDVVNRQFTAAGPNRLWATDLTVIATGEGPLWLASIRDAFSRKVIAWETSDVADADLVCAVLEYALRSRRPPADGSLVHHADHGSQYTSIKLTTRLVRAGITASMGTVGDSYDKPWSSHCSPSVLSRGFRLDVRRAPVGEGHALGGSRGVGAGGLEEVAVLVVVGDALEQAVAAPDFDGLFAGAGRSGVFGEGEQAAFA
jgi:hypothetical protein